MQSVTGVPPIGILLLGTDVARGTRGTEILLIMSAGITYADNITIWDEDGYTAGGQGGEDNETEPGMIRNAFWDLESFDLLGNELGITASFNLKDGYKYDGHKYTLGDIFIDVDPTVDAAQFGTIMLPGGHCRDLDPTRLNYGYEYAIRLTYGIDQNGNEEMNYNVYTLNDNSLFIDVLESGNQPASNPYRLDLDAGNNEVIKTSGTFTYTSGFHNSVTGIDLSFIGSTEFIAHATMDCGNDNLMGSGSISVPEPSIIGLLGIGLLSLIGFRKKNRR